MAEHYSFFDPQVVNGVLDREYNAQQFTNYFKSLVTTGLMVKEGGELRVTSDGSSMVTTIDTGVAFILGRYYENDSPLSLTHDTETLGKDRIDRIVVRMNLNTEARYVKAFIKKGIAGTSPVPPELTQTNDLYELSLAQVRIIGGQTYISSDDVISERGIDIICPWAGSNILPSFNDNLIAEHVNNFTMHIPYVVTEGSANDYRVSMADIRSYTEGLALAVKINVQNTGSSTININDYGAKKILKSNGTELSSGNLKANSIYTIRYNGVNFILQGEGGEYGTATASDVLTGKTIGTESGLVTGTMPNRGNLGTITPGTTNKNYNPGYYPTAFTVAGDPDLLAENIVAGKNIFGVLGTAVTGGMNFRNGSGSVGSDGKIIVRGMPFQPKIVIGKYRDTNRDFSDGALPLKNDEENPDDAPFDGNWAQTVLVIDKSLLPQTLYDIKMFMRRGFITFVGGGEIEHKESPDPYSVQWIKHPDGFELDLGGSDDATSKFSWIAIG